MNHDWVYARCREVEKNRDGYLDLWSREHFKSSSITFGLTVQDILRDPEITCVIFSHTRPIAKAFLSQIKSEFEMNTYLKKLFPDVLYAEPHKESPRWSLDDGIIVKRCSNPKEATVEAWGIVDGQPISKHYKLMVYDDVVTRDSVSTPEQIKKTTESWSLSLNLSSGDNCKKRYIGTRYHCLSGDSRILMSDFTHKEIKDIVVGDEVVGWKMVDKLKSGQMRKLQKAKVLNVGKYEQQPVNKYFFDCGRTIVCTPDHKWWRGPNGSGKEYGALGMKYHEQKSVRRLLDPINFQDSYDTGWLAGFFDGEGSIRKNSKHSSGNIQISQSIKYPEIIKRLRETFKNLGFEWVEDWNKQKNPKHYDVCMFKILGGWRETYRFLAQINPSKKNNLINILFSRLKTDKVNVIDIIEYGKQDVYWIETETGNYIAEGFCSKNSLDTYASIMERNAAIPRIYAATEDGTFNGKPVFWSQKTFDEKVEQMGRMIASSQLLQDPLSDDAIGFMSDWIQYYDNIEYNPNWNYYIVVDPAGEKKKTSDYTVMLVIGLGVDKNYYLVDGVRDRMNLTERTKKLFHFVRKWQPKNVGYEKYGMQSDIEHIKYVMDAENYRFSIMQLGGISSKNDRIRRLIPKFENHKVYLPRKLLFCGYDGRAYDLIQLFVEDEFETFPVSKHDDMLDAFSRILDDDLMAVFPKEEAPVTDYPVKKYDILSISEYRVI